MIDNQIKSENKKVLEKGIYAALETYANVHRGTGHHSRITSHLYDQARDIVLEYLQLHKSQYTVIFGNAYRATVLTRQLNPKYYQIITSKEVGLALGVTAVVVRKRSLPGGAPAQTGGGTTNLIATDWVLWTYGPERYEAGTPAIINVITFACALKQLIKSRADILHNSEPETTTAQEILYHDELELYSGKELLKTLRKSLIGHNHKVPTIYSDRTFINLDNSASTPTFKPVYDVFREALYQPLHVQQDIIQEVKSICSRFLNAPQDKFDIIFTSNTTEAINLAAESLGRYSKLDTDPVIVNTMLEHSSNDLPWRMLSGHSLIRITANDDGFIDMNELENILKAYNQDNQNDRKRIMLVSITGASNVLGTCNDIGAISRVVHKYGAQLLVDAAQLIAHRNIDMDADGIDYLAFSGHKIYAPFGSGALIARHGYLKFNKDEQQQIEASGSENTAGIAALGKALYLMQRIGMDVIRREEQELTAQLLNGMLSIPGLRIHGLKSAEDPQFDRKLGVIPFEIKGMMPDVMAKKLSKQGGIGLRYGCHCAHILVKHILQVGAGLEKFQKVMLTVLPNIKLPGVTRVSLGLSNTTDEVDEFLQILRQISIPGAKNESGQASKHMKPVWTDGEIKKQLKDRIKRASKQVYGEC
ncbi:MAG: aminotransferase class V-fold PLP-dependent enzyme [Bacteroidetes bacterium]|jgi:selenocysteine lyase/cysteine desulfurase|nr:aminotransferase class V-fold PLP-dependent enzyme [Bacteroidota bacterium]